MHSAIVLFPEGRNTGWFSIRRLKAEGPYEDISFVGGDIQSVPVDGPLQGTKIGSSGLWCAVLGGRLIIAPRPTATPPPLFEGAKIRGYYCLDQHEKLMEWTAIGERWDPNEIDEYRLLSNDAYRIYNLAAPNPEHLFLFGAGASYGSDAKWLLEKGRLPPLGNNLFSALCASSTTCSWHSLPRQCEQYFQTRSFEEAMDLLNRDDEGGKGSFARDLELSLYFSQFSPSPSNLYSKLARQIARQLKRGGWTGAAITLNYERLLEESLMRNEVFTVVKGVTFYDSALPSLQINQLFEVNYPHGACQFFLHQSWFGGEGEVVFKPGAGITGNVGANHLLDRSNIRKFCEARQIPLICRYESAKRASVGNYFTDVQRDRSVELCRNAKSITIVGVQCVFPRDPHIWDTLGATKARILYVEPSITSQSQFRSWAEHYGKKQPVDYEILGKTFKDAFEGILEFNKLEA